MGSAIQPNRAFLQSGPANGLASSLNNPSFLQHVRPEKPSVGRLMKMGFATIARDCLARIS